MKLLVAQLDQHGASVVPPSRGSPLNIRTRGGLTVPLDPCPDPAAPDSPTSLYRLCLPRWSVDAAVGALVRLDHEREVLRQDHRWSDEGKRSEFVAARRSDRNEPGPLPVALRAIAHACGEFAKHEVETRKTEAERYVVPALQAQSFGEAMRDFEIRSVVRSLKGDDRGRMIQRLGSGDDVDLLLATLRSPLPAHDLHEVASTAWRTLRDRNDPAGRAELDLKLATIEWAKRSLGHVTGSMRRLLSVDDEPFDRGQVYQLLRDEQSAAGKLSAAAALFGFSEHDAARHELLIQRRAAA